MLALLLAVSLEFTQQDAHVSYEIAKELVKACASRDAGTSCGAKAADCLASLVRSSGIDVRKDVFYATTPKGKRRFANLYSELKVAGESADWLVIVSHYDTKPFANCPGANDGASTSGLLVGLARAFVRQAKANGNLMLIWTDGEECMNAYADNDGLWGSKHAAEWIKSSGRSVRAVICADMLGDRDLSITVPQNGTLSLAKIAVQAASRAGYRDLVKMIPGQVKDDHVAFLDKGYEAIDLIDFDYGPGNSYWHTEKDTIDKISELSLLKSGKVLVEMLNVLI